MNDTVTQVYFIDKPFFQEAMMLCAFKNKLNWLEEGMSLLSWEYKLVAETKEADINKVCKHFKDWNGNKKSRVAGHRALTVGDIIVSGENVRLLMGRGWLTIPACIWKEVRKT